MNVDVFFFFPNARTVVEGTFGPIWYWVTVFNKSLMQEEQLWAKASWPPIPGSAPESCISRLLGISRQIKAKDKVFHSLPNKTLLCITFCMTSVNYRENVWETCRYMSKKHISGKRGSLPVWCRNLELISRTIAEKDLKIQSAVCFAHVSCICLKLQTPCVWTENSLFYLS